MPSIPQETTTVVRHVTLAHGPVSYAEAGAGTAAAVLLLHQTPRSWDEYRDVLPRLAAGGYRAIALDTPGFGASAPLPGGPTAPNRRRSPASTPRRMPVVCGARARTFIPPTDRTSWIATWLTR